ncbi:CAAX amino terminal protease [Corchorus capsularis]|uniref:CAAX amino terminal protease n=1 Tax=Corchorus capsularis TaxID=210143 RepID=A0A1R3HA31_COCAP|nr:CAAX amino terminal protease [Corchorus capsularis]
MEGVNERLVKEDRHFVRLNSGRMIQASGNRGDKATELEYQRICISTEDGGVISIDWPANLDLNDEHGLDTTVLVVPGTPEGSMDEKVKAFVREAVCCGFFPVVMNPRGCASSPLTTPRLFTAADSDDLSAAIQFVNKARPWNTLMGVGWGYGANMLTKYLAEVGEKTPLTAATCIDNPFDLDEATRATPYHIALNEKLTGGLVDILRSNKELFQGRTKGFDVEKALSAKSVRDFEKAISMVSYGFKAIEDFYSKSSTRSLVGNVKIPVLFIQNDDGSVPLFSIPRGLIAENPYTSLLLCSCSPSRATVSWCHHLTIEWLTAVELGLLKGRHPLLKDVDVTINPSKGLAFEEGRLTNKGRKVKKLLDHSRSNAINGYSINPPREMLEDGDTAASIRLRSRQDLLKDVELGDKGLHEVHNDMLPQTKSVEEELVKEEASPEDSEMGQVLQTAQVVMNMLDVTMPGTLKEAEKQKVLAAVNQGETVIKALEGAVPEDVRGKLTAAVSVFMQTQGTHLKQGIARIPKMSSQFKSKGRESVSDAHSADEIKKIDDLADGSDSIEVGSDKTTGGQGSDFRPSENFERSSDLGPQPISSHQGDIPSSIKKDTNEPGKIHESDEVTKEKASAHADSSETGLETSAKPTLTTRAEKVGSPDETLSIEGKADRDGGIGRIEIKDETNPQKKEEKGSDSSTDQNKVTPAATAEVTVSAAGSSEAQPVEGERNDNQKTENKDLQHVLDQNKSSISDPNPQTFSVSQALDALTGMDDSTQVAVNSVFGVIENMISQLEEKDDKESHDRDEVRTENNDSVPGTQDTFEDKEDNENDHKLREIEGSKNNYSMMSDGSHDHPMHNDNASGKDLQYDSASVEESPQIPFSSEGTDNDNSLGNGARNSLGRSRSNDNSDSSVNNIPSYISANRYGHFLQSEYFRLLSEPTNEPLDVDSTTALLLDYFPEEGQWKLLEQNGDPIDDDTTHSRESEAPAAAEVNETENYIEPSYVILDSETQHEPIQEFEAIDTMNVNVEGLEETMQLVKVTILESLQLEVDRRLSVSDLQEMESQLALDIETVATAVSLSIGDDEALNFEGKENVVEDASGKVCTLNGENIIRSISSAVQSTSYLRRVLPVGVVVGSSLAALRKYFNLSTLHEYDQNEIKAAGETKLSGKRSYEKSGIMEIDQMPVSKTGQNGTSHSPTNEEGSESGLKSLNKEGVLVGAVTAALGASALLAPEQDSLEEKGTAETSSKTSKEKGNQHKEPEMLEEAAADKNQVNIVTSLAEKALSVAGPVVPTKEDGELDQERLVAMLADLGQRGGMLRLVGKIALLWGGIRGAMSLTDRLIMFLHIAERPLYQRILGFVGMGLVLWSPVVVPLLPTLVQSWTTKTPSAFAELVCIFGFYTAVTILVVLWGKRIRGYENPLKQYGLELTSSSEIQGLLMGLIGGVVLVILIQSTNALLGCVSFSWPSNIVPSSLDFMARLKVIGQLLAMAVRGLLTATGVVLVEELLFRSWLPDEIAADLGYHRGIIISGLAFSVFQRSLMAIPGLWLLSLALAGIRQRNGGNLSIPIGLRAGIMASSFFLQTDFATMWYIPAPV